MIYIKGKQDLAKSYSNGSGNEYKRGLVLRKEVTELDWGDVRSFCIETDLYCRGTNEDYKSLSDMLYYWQEQQKEITVEMLQVVAEDILEHSEPDTSWNLEAVMYELSKRVRRTYVVGNH